MLSEELTEELQYFVGKVCTVLTGPMAMPVDDKSLSTWFTMQIDGVDGEAIVGTDIRRGTKQVFFHPVIGIVEEEVLTESDPRYEKLQEQAKSAVLQKQALQAASAEAKTVQIDQLQEQAAAMKSKWSTAPTEREKK